MDDADVAFLAAAFGSCMVATVSGMVASGSNISDLEDALVFIL